MRRRWILSISIGIVLVLGRLATAENPQDSHFFSSDLVAWSAMQQPTAPEQSQTRQQPKPEPVPETQPSQQPTVPKAGKSSATSAGTQAPTADTFTGTVSKEADGFTLKVSETTSYKLDNQQQVQQYDGQRVRVTGTLDPSINLIHVDKIEPLS